MIRQSYVIRMVQVVRVITLCCLSLPSCAQNLNDANREGRLLAPAPAKKINFANRDYVDQLTEVQKNSEPDGYIIAYQLSFANDFCGKLEIGRQIRAIILDKVESCEFNEKVKLQFLRTAAKNSDAAFGELYNYFLKQQSVPEKTITNESCNEYLTKNEKRLHFESLLNSYEQSEVKLKDLRDIVPSCAQGATF